MSNHHSTSGILLLLASLLHILGVLLPRNRPPKQLDKQESTNTNTGVIHIRRCQLSASPTVFFSTGLNSPVTGI